MVLTYIAMAEVVNLSLPALNPKYNGLPRRYEETRPAFVQNFTHQRIVGIGRDIQSRVMNSIQNEKLQALRKAEEAVWEQANKEKAEAIQKVKEEGKAHTEKMLQRKIKEYEQKIKEECLKVEMTMQKIASEQLKEEQERAERALAEAVRRTEDRCHEELLAAVDTARKEEKKIAADAEARMIKNHTAEVEALKKSAAEDKRTSLEQLKTVKDQERVRAVKEAQEYTQKLADKRLQEIREEHKEEVTKMEDIIERWQREVRAREAIIAKLEAAKQRVGERLMDVRFYFQDFINRVKMFEAGQSDYLLPPMYLDEIERNGVLSQPL